MIVEPFAGSAGVVIPPAGYLQRLRELCTAHNILLIFRVPRRKRVVRVIFPFRCDLQRSCGGV